MFRVDDNLEGQKGDQGGGPWCLCVSWLVCVVVGYCVLLLVWTTLPRTPSTGPPSANRLAPADSFRETSPSCNLREATCNYCYCCKYGEHHDHNTSVCWPPEGGGRRFGGERSGGRRSGGEKKKERKKRKRKRKIKKEERKTKKTRKTQLIVYTNNCKFSFTIKILIEIENLIAIIPTAIITKKTHIQLQFWSYSQLKF